MYLIVFYSSWMVGNIDSTRMRTLPKEFYFGVSTASYQVEGGWNAAGKCLSQLRFHKMKTEQHLIKIPLRLTIFPYWDFPC